ncbi:FAD-dependent oxidoreductase [Solirubrobacter ginsenosidimutans]|uniref:FAD-dependent oxidoreductase n=1 Tax=Solirubrobacter ginsenosidimutans TaxID=490573 RepID=A0A9X3MMN1_9ACTN|nr:FAD-dependent oxidoreductase [Solirubrobacter ginsenosidimutans]MDA0159069.1 FAD-dependent oxidoreductase [Solirubrobacter ginsenosidimutans]
MDRVVVVGASLAGLTAADALRVQGYEGAITIVGGESHAPYTRPPLSKGVLTGAEPPETVRLVPPEDDIELRIGTTAVALDRERQVVELENGERVPYDGLVIATGGRARSLVAPDQTGEYRLRTLDDCLALQAAFRARPNVLIVGAGFLGMEIASTCRVLGLDVTVVDREPPLQRVLGEYLGRLITEAALDAGVRIKVAAGDARLLGSPVHGVQLGDGSVEEGDIVISAVGDVPNSGWLGLRGPVVVDDRCRVAPGIVAAGDIAAVGGLRTPHWASAVDQARVAAAALLHGDAAPALNAVPYYWTEGHGLEIKVCGPLPVHGEPVVLEGSVAERDAVLRWPEAAATINHRMPLGKLKRLAAPREVALP